MKLYMVEGRHDTDLEGMIFAVCTTREKAKKALEMSVGGEEGELQITEMIADSVIINDKVITID